MEKHTQNKSRFFSAVLLQIIILLILIGYHWLVSFFGSSVIFSIEPADPRDLLRGNYLEYSIPGLSKINRYQFERFDFFNGNLRDDFGYYGDSNFEYSTNTNPYYSSEGREIYITIDERFPNLPENASFSKPVSGLFIKGTITDINEEYVEVNYGIENYYIPENSVTESELSNFVIKAEVSINSDGKAVLKRLLVGGETWPKK